MKKFMLSSVLIFGFLLQAAAQNRIVERSFAINQDDAVRLDLQFGETITVKSWDQNKVAFRAVIEINGGRLNDALQLDFDQSSGRVEIASDYNKEKLKEGRREDCPDNYSRYSWSDDDDGGHVVCSRIRYEISVPRQVDLEVESISGDIELVGLAGPIRAKSISGFVDLSWPSGNAVKIDLKTISGEAFSDLEDLQFDNKKEHIPLVGYTLKGRIGTGGPRVSLESVSGNIYLRKANG